MANLLSTNVSGRLYTSGHVDTNTVGAAFRFYDSSTFRGGLGLDDWAHSGSANDITLYVANDSSFYVSTSGTKRLRISSGEARFITYSPDTNYNIRIQGGDQFNAYYGENATTLYINWNGGATRFGGETHASGSSHTGGYLYTNSDIRVGEIWGYGGIYRSSGHMMFGTEGGHWYFQSSNNTRAYISQSDGNIWMQWAGDWLSNLLGDKQAASTAINTSNIGSQSVSYASSAGNADTLDGYHADTLGNRAYTARGFTVGGDENTYYPVTFSGTGGYAFNRYSIYRWYGWTAPDTWYLPTHRGGLTFDFEWSGDTAWGGNDHTLRVTQFSETYTTMVAGLTLPVTQGVCVWLRGGGAYYEIQVDGNPVSPQVHIDGFTAGNGSFYGPRTDTSNVQAEIYNRMPVRNSSEIYDGGNRVVNTGGDAQVKSGYLQSNSSLRAPIFYDSENTSYYLDPSSTTSIRTVGSWRADSSAWDGEFSGKIQYHSNHWYIQAADLFIYRNAGGSNVFTINQSGDAQANSSMRAPIFYDSENTTYYVDPNNESNLSVVRTALRARQGMTGYGEGNWVSDFSNTPVSAMTFGQDKYSDGPAGTWWFQVNMRHNNPNDLWGTQLAYGWEDNANEIYQRNVTGGIWSGWVRYINTNNYPGILDARYYTESEVDSLLSAKQNASTAITTSNIGSQSVSYATSAGNADTVDGYHSYSLHTVTTDPGTAGNGTISIGNNGSYTYIQSHASQPLHLNPLGNDIYLDSTVRIGSRSTRLTSNTYTGYVEFRGSDSNYLGIGCIDNNGWGYIESVNNSNGLYFLTNGRFAFDNGPLTPYDDNELSLGTSSHRWSDVYTAGWYRNFGQQGIYNQSYGTHFYSRGGATWVVTGSGGSVELEFRSNHNSTLRGYVYATTSNEIGFLSEDGNWVLKTWNRGVEAYGSMRAPIYYDSNDTSYYLDPAGYSRLSRVHPRNLGGATLNEYSTNVGVSQSGNWEKTTFIDGSEVLAHVSTGSGVSSCYQWFNTEWVSVDPNKDYEFSVWVKSTGNDNIYMGWHERNASEGTLTSNPYFHTGQSNTNGTWIKLTARLKGWQTTSGYGPGEPDRYASSQSMLSWLPSGGESVDGVMHETTAFVHMRCGTCYGTVSGSKTYFYAPRIREITYDEVQNHIVIPYYNGSNWGGKLRFGYNDWGYYGIGMYGAAGEFRMSSDSGNLDLRVDGWIQSHNGMYSNIYYDADDYSYYVNPNGTSNLASLNLNGDLRVSDGNRIWLRGSSSGSAVGAQTYIFGDGLNLKIKGDDNVQLLGDGENVILHASYLGRVGINTELPATALDVNGPAAIRGTNRLYWGHSSENLNTWTTAQYSSGSTHYFNAQEFRFTNEGYGSSIFAVINSAGIYAPVFYDYDNGNYYLNPSGGSRLGNIYDDGGETYGTKYFYSNKGATTSINAANTPTLQAFSNDAGPAFMSFHRGGYYAVNFGLDNDNVMRIGGWSAGYNRWTLDMDGNNTVAGSVTASGFYDSDNPNYYLNPTSTGSSLVVVGYIKSKFTYRYNSAAGLPNQDNPVKTATGVLATFSVSGGGPEYIIIKTRVPQDSYQMGGFTIDLFANYGSTNAKTTISLGGYWNPESNNGFEGWEYNTTNPNVRPSIQVMRDITDGSTCFAIQLSSKSYSVVVARDLYLGYNSADIEGWLDWSIFGADDLGNYTNNDTVACRHAMPVDNWYGNTYIAGDGRFYGTIFYDTNDTGYYVDPNSTSRLYNITATGILKVFNLDSGSGSGWDTAIEIGETSAGEVNNSFPTYINNGYGVNIRKNSDGMFLGLVSYDGGSNFHSVIGWGDDTSESLFFRYNGGDRASLDSYGNFIAIGDITAYSDARIKTNVQTIENALDKTLQLRGVTYNRTDSEDKSTKVGVIAQEVLEVVPEVVNQDASGMYNVSYGNLTAVLIEAIKEQQKQIDELKEIINGLTK